MSIRPNFNPNPENSYENTVNARPPPIQADAPGLRQPLLHRAHHPARSDARSEAARAPTRSDRRGRNPGGLGFVDSLHPNEALAEDAAHHPCALQLQNGSVLVWLLGDTRLIRDDARLFFRRATLSEDDDAKREDEWKDEPEFCDSFSEIDPEEGDYARVLQCINEFLPVKELAGRLIELPVLRQFGLVENEKVDHFLATAFGTKREPPKTNVAEQLEGRLVRKLASKRPRDIRR